MEKVIKAALLGAGTVGGGTYKLIDRQKSELVKKTGANVEITKVLVRNINKARPGIPNNVFVDNFDCIINDPEIEIVIELMGGMEPAKTMITASLEAGKNVVTANKDLIAECGGELLDIAKANGVDLLFEAAVAGGIPIIRPLKQCLAGNEIDCVMGIMNGTTNFILTKMCEEGMGFDQALKIAQELGYAEADPTADVEAYDAGRKLAILASIAFHSRVRFSDVFTEGITKIDAKDIAYAKSFDSVIKLVGVAKNTEEGIEVGVYPMLLDKNHPLASVRDSFNAVFVHGDAVGDTMFYGRGAGEFPTASAVVGDIIDVVRDIQCNSTARIGCTCYRQTPITTFNNVKNKFLVRTVVINKPGVLASIATVFGVCKVSITRVIQNLLPDGNAELVILTEPVKEYHMQDAMAHVRELDSIVDIRSIIRQM